LIVGNHAAITHRHLIDCTDEVSVGAYSIVAGFQSQLLTHSIDLTESRQSCRPIRIGNYCFVGTNCVVLGGSSLPDYAVVGANSLLNDAYTESYMLYGGVPAKPIKELEKNAKFFLRSEGFVV
jgi:acetyltransferase-like isoleucine patch superfamily enzyme